MGFHERRLTRIMGMFVLISVAGPGFAAEAHMYRCKDANGRVYYTDRRDVTCEGGQTDELTKQGIVLDRPDAVRPGETPEARQARIAQERADRALLQSYSSEQQIEAAKQRNLQTPLLAVKYAKKKLAIYTEQSDRTARARGENPGGDRPAPLSLIEEIDAALSDIAQVRVRSGEQAARRGAGD